MLVNYCKMLFSNVEIVEEMGQGLFGIYNDLDFPWNT